MEDHAKNGVLENLELCPVPEQVPPPLMSEWLELLRDPESRTRKVSDTSVKNKELDTYYLYNPKVEDTMFAMVPSGAKPDNTSAITRINGDRYKDGKRTEYYGQSFADSLLRLAKVEFGYDGNDSYVARQTVLYVQPDIPKPIDKGVYEAQFDKLGHLINYFTGESTGKYGFQTPDSPHYQEYRQQLHPTQCH
jgi:hypothetical protein